MFRKLLTLTLFFLFATRFFSQTFVAEVEDLGRYYRLSFTIDTRDFSDFKAPSLDDFSIYSGPNTSYSSFFAADSNGRKESRESSTITYIIAPKRNGKITIAPASVRAGGKTLRSNSVSIEARKAAQPDDDARRGRGNGDAAQNGAGIAPSDLFFETSVSRTSVFEQEAVLVTYRYFIREGLGRTNIALVKRPEFKGVIAQDLPLPADVSEQLVQRNGHYYITGINLQYLIFPQQAGKITVPSVQFDCVVAREMRSINPIDAYFNSGGLLGVKVSRKTAERIIDVKVLPKPKPADYSGGVGDFSIKGELVTATPKTNEVATYRVTVTGRGNMNLITAPSLKLPADFDTYEPKTDNHTVSSPEGVSGNLTFDYTFVPRNVGAYEIPAVSFVFFDPKAGQYRTVRTQPVKMQIAQGTNTRDDVERELQLRNSDIRPAHTLRAADFRAISLIPAWGGAAYWGLTAALIAVAVMIWYALRKYAAFAGNTVRRRRSEALRKAVRRLATAKTLLKAADATGFYAAVQESLAGYVADVSNRPTAGLSRERMSELLTAGGVDETLLKRFRSVLETCEFARFAPTVEGGKESILGEAESVLKAIDGIIK